MLSIFTITLHLQIRDIFVLYLQRHICVVFAGLSCSSGITEENIRDSPVTLMSSDDITHILPHNMQTTRQKRITKVSMISFYSIVNLIKLIMHMRCKYDILLIICWLYELQPSDHHFATSNINCTVHGGSR